MKPHAVPVRHLLLGILVVAVWGANFTVIKVALGTFPPLLFATLRFTFVVFPAVFLFPRPKVPLRYLAGYGLFIGVGQFGLLYLAIRSQISPGLASLVLQMQVFFTIGLSMLLVRERVRPFQVVALGLAVVGIAVILVNTGGSVTLLGLALCLVAAFSWAAGNVVSKRAGSVNMVAFVAWSSLFAVPPLIALSLLTDGPADIADGLRSSDSGTWAAVAYQSFGNSIFGYAAWGWLLSRHPAASITPLALLTPVFGMAVAHWWLGESLPAWKLAAAGLVIAGLALNIGWPYLRRSPSGEPLVPAGKTV